MLIFLLIAVTYFNPSPMKKKILFVLFMAIVSGAHFVFAQEKVTNPGVQLLVRGDDIGSFHAANLACILSYTEGIVRSVEIMVPCPWYPEAVELLNEHPGLDVGVHLVLSSEWRNMKWRPLTGMSSITDKSGYFYPMIWTNENFPPERAFNESDWKLRDVERELRSQIELAKRDIKSLSHLSSHMGFTGAAPSIDSLVKALAIEYKLNINPNDYGVERLNYKMPEMSGTIGRIEAFIEAIHKLTPGIYMFVEHPALDSPEMESIEHTGYTEVSKDRQIVTDMFTSKKILEEIEKSGIELISYADLKKRDQNK